MVRILARSAECVFWLARQVERADSLARILDVNAAYSHDARGAQNWEGILRIFSSEEEFAERYEKADGESVLRFYVLDRNNPGSIVSSIEQARDNARSLRPLISTEMWEQINRFCIRMRRLKSRDLMPDRLHNLLSTVKEGCQTHVGITAETFYHDEAWLFYMIGQQIERADQTTRLLDTKYETLLPNASGVGSGIDIGQWNALLRSAAGFHAYRRVHPRDLTPVRVVGFMLLNNRFPRAVRTCVNIAAQTVYDLRREHNLMSGPASEQALMALRERLSAMTAEGVVESGLHEALDSIQEDLIVATNRMGEEFFGRPKQGRAKQKPAAR